MSEIPAAEAVTYAVQWLQDPSAVPAPVNQFIIQGGPAVGDGTKSETFILVFGHVTPPFQLPMPLQDAQQFENQGVAYVAPVARLSFTPERLRELHTIVGTVLARHDEP